MVVLKVFQSFLEILHIYKENTWVWPYEILSPGVSDVMFWKQKQWEIPIQKYNLTGKKNKREIKYMQ